MVKFPIRRFAANIAIAMLYSVMAASVKQKQVASTFPHTATIVSSGKLAYCIKKKHIALWFCK